MRGTAKRRRVVALVILAVVVAGCGTDVSRDTLAATSGADPRTIGSAASATGGAGGADLASAGSSAETTGGVGPAATTATGTARASGAGIAASGAGVSPGSSAGDPPGPAAGAAIVVGSFGTGTGPIGANIADAPVAVRAWVADVNARGGLAGHPVHLVMADDGGDPTRALGIAKRMVEEDRVLAFFGVYGVTTLDGVAHYLEEQRVPVIGALPAPVTDVSPVFFLPAAGTKGIYRGMLSGLVRQAPEIRRIALIACREANTCPMGAAVQREYAPRLGLEIVHDAQASIAQPDYTAEVIAARSAEAEAVIVILDFASTLRYIRSANRQGWKPRIAAASNLYTDRFAEAGGEEVEGTLGTASTLPYATSPLMAAYRDAVATFVPSGLLGDYGAQLWVAGKLFERIAPDLGSEPTREGIFAALYELRDETLGGLIPPTTFPEGAHGDVNLCQVPIRLEGGQWIAPFGDDYVCSY